LIIEPDQIENLKYVFLSLRKVMKLYSSLKCNILSSGEFLISGPGYLYLDCVMNDLKNVFGEEDLKISQILINCKETIKENFPLNKSFGFNKIIFSIEKNNDNFCDKSFISDAKIFESYLKNNIDSWQKNKKALKAGYISEKFIEKNILDRKKSNLIWFVGPRENKYGNCKLKLKDKVFFIPKEQKESIKQGFEIAVTKGPFFSEPMNQVDFQIFFPEMLEPKYKKIFSFPGKIRRFFHWVCLKNKPIAQYPVYLYEVLLPLSSFTITLNLLKANQGKILSIKKIPYQDSSVIRSIIPLKSLLEFEKELSKVNQGKIFSLNLFDNWE
jgi:116 kDa U5 small nuclear ribonucleoprotein component